VPIHIEWVFFLYMGTTLVIYGSHPICGTFFQRGPYIHVSLQDLFKHVVLLFPQRPPQCFNRRDIYLLTLQICGGNEKHFFPLLITHLKGLLHFEDINLQRKPNIRHGHEPSQRNVHLGFFLGRS